MATSIQPLIHRSGLRPGAARVFKRAAGGLAVGLCALAFVLMAAAV
jgi:hypothetical protein